MLCDFFRGEKSDPNLESHQQNFCVAPSILEIRAYVIHLAELGPHHGIVEWHARASPHPSPTALWGIRYRITLNISCTRTMLEYRAGDWQQTERRKLLIGDRPP